MKWDNITRVAGVFGMLASYYVFTMYGSSFEVLAFVIGSISTLVAPELVDNFPRGPDK